jgi:hypothetical protein
MEGKDGGGVYGFLHDQGKCGTGLFGIFSGLVHPAHCRLVYLTMFRMFFLQECLYSDVEVRETVALTHVLRPMTVSENVLDKYV